MNKHDAKKETCINLVIPALHSLQEIEPVLSAHVPAGQARHDLLPLAG